MRLRLRALQLEELAPIRFILAAGLAGGVVQGVPGFFLENARGGDVHVAQAVALGVIAVLWWGVAVLVWWIAVRRRRFSIWKTALHVTLAWALADMLHLGLEFVSSSIQTKGVFAQALAQHALDVTLTNLELLLTRSLIRFVGALVLVAIGRQLPGRVDSVASQPATPADPEAVA